MRSDWWRQEGGNEWRDKKEMRKQRVGLKGVKTRMKQHEVPLVLIADWGRHAIGRRRRNAKEEEKRMTMRKRKLTRRQVVLEREVEREVQQEGEQEGERRSLCERQIALVSVGSMTGSSQ